VLTEVLSSQYHRLALVGLGGVGKTQIAIEYTHRIRDSSPDTWVLWVHAGSLANFEKDYRQIATLMRIPGRDDRNANVFKLVYDWLSNEANGKWVMVIDNADDIAVLNARPPNCPTRIALNEATGVDEETAPKVIDFIPSSRNGSILITSRNREVAFELTGRYKHIIAVEPMNEAEAVRLLKNTLVGDFPQDEMAGLAQTLDYMPLAITQAGALINKRFPRLSIPSFIAEFNKSDAERTQLLDNSAVEPGRDRERTNSIVATWHITFQYVRRTKPSAARLLSLMCLFNRQGIPETLLVGQYGEDSTSLTKLAPRIPWRKKWRHVRRKGQTKGGNELACNFGDDWQTLTDFSLIKTTADGHYFDMHRLVQLTTKKWLDLQNDLQRWKDKFIVLMDENCPDLQNELQRQKDKSFGLSDQNYPTIKSLMPHAMAAVSYRPLGGEVLRPWGCLMHKLASHKAEQANFDVARNLHQAALEAFQITLGVDDPQSISCVREVAYILSLQKDYTLSETLHRQVLAARERVLGQEHPDTLRSMDDLGDVLRNVQKYDESDATKLRALKIKESVFGAESKTTQETMGDISFNMMFSGKNSEAEAMLLKENAARNKDALLKFDEIWCHDMCGLGKVTQFRGKLKEAEAIFRKVYLVQQKAMTTGEGSDRQLTETSYLLAEVLKIQEHYAEAEGLYRQVLNGYVKARREEKETLSIMGQLAVVLKKVGKLKEAEELRQKAMKGWEHIERENDDEVVIVSVYTLAGLFYEDELLDEALILYERAYTSVKTTVADGDEASLSPFLEDYTRCGDMIAMRDIKVPTSALGNRLDIDIELQCKDAREQAVPFDRVPIAV
jgi:hypothetical protein